MPSGGSCAQRAREASSFSSTARVQTSCLPATTAAGVGCSGHSHPRGGVFVRLPGGSFRPHDFAVAALGGRCPSSGRRLRLRTMSPYLGRRDSSNDGRLRSDQLASHALECTHSGTAQSSFHTKTPVLLRYADRDSMAYSREVRLPFLDRRVAEFALSVPPTFLYSEGVTKRVLRQAMRGLVWTRFSTGGTRSGLNLHSQRGLQRRAQCL